MSPRRLDPSRVRFAWRGRKQFDQRVVERIRSNRTATSDGLRSSGTDELLLNNKLGFELVVLRVCTFSLGRADRTHSMESVNAQ